MYKQKHLYDKPQYGYVVFWGGAPVIWNSKRHQQIPQSVSQAEFVAYMATDRGNWNVSRTYRAEGNQIARLNSTEI